MWGHSAELQLLVDRASGQQILQLFGGTIIFPSDGNFLIPIKECREEAAG